MPEYKLQPGYAFKRRNHDPWRDAEIVVLPQSAEGATRVMYHVKIDGAPCAVFATAAGLYAQSHVACRVK
jgi:hypothetical protein